MSPSIADPDQQNIPLSLEERVKLTSLKPTKPSPTSNSKNETDKNQTPLQKHCAYFDTDNDNIIWPRDTYTGCRKWGWNPLLSLLTATIIHFGLSYLSVPGWLPDPFFRLYNQNMHKNMHGSASQTYDNQGRYRAQIFESVFEKYDEGNKGGLSKGDVWRFLSGERLAFDPWGWTATTLEWVALYLLIWPDDGIMKKDDIRGSFDGSLFYKKAEEHARKMQGLKKSS